MRNISNFSQSWKVSLILSELRTELGFSFTIPSFKAKAKKQQTFSNYTQDFHMPIKHGSF